MRMPRIITLFVIILFATSFAFAHKVRVDYDHSVNFSKYKTFMWVEKPETENPLMSERIVKAVNAQLAARGLKPVTSDADLGIKAQSIIQEIPVYNTVYDTWGGGWGWGWGGPGYSTTFVSTYLEGTTIVDLLDAESGQPIWHATSTGGISSKPEKATKKTVEQIGKMFAGFPPIGFRERISD